MTTQTPETRTHETLRRDARDVTVWLVDLTYTQQTIAADVMPQAVGGIAAYAEAYFALKEPIRIIKYPEKLIEFLERFGAPTLIGFSNYVWNHNLSYRFCESIKKNWPSTVTVMGGPNYPITAEEQTQFLQSRPALDFYVEKEGEIAFARLLEALLDSQGDVESVKRKDLGSVHAMTRGGTAHLRPPVARITNLSDIPSPYLSGRLDEFFDGALMPIIQTNRGCPFSCTFCVEGERYYNKVNRGAGAKAAAEIAYIGRHMKAARSKGGRNDLFIADSNFGMYREDLDVCRSLKDARTEYGWPEYINVATGKNQKERVLEASRLIDGALRLSGSVQSLDPEVLENIKRSNISADGLMDLALSASEVGANSYSEIILALPGDSREKHFKTVRTVLEAGFTNIYLFQLMLLPGTDLATRATKDKYRMDTRYRVLPRCYGHFELCGEPIVAAEIEEVCVAHSTLSFDDYIACRKMHLMVTIFYNDSVFSTILKLLGVLGISRWKWIEALLETPAPPGLQALFDRFAEATATELWQEKTTLEEFVQEPGVVQRFIDGELGNNLLFVHKTRAITEFAPDLATLAAASVLKVLAAEGRDGEAVREFVADAVRYHELRMTNLFDGSDTEIAAEFRFDLAAFYADANPRPIESYRFSDPRQIRFVLDEAQRDVIARFLAIYGRTPVGIGRILSKVHTKKLMRHGVVDASSIAPDTGALRYQLSGLQN